MRINYQEEMPKESAIMFYRVLEKMIIDELPQDPKLIGLFLEDSLVEFKNLEDKYRD